MLLKETKTFVLSQTYTRHPGAINHRTGSHPYRYRLEWYTNPLVTLIDRDIVYL